MGKAPKKILVADDELMIRKVLRRWLTHAGYIPEDAGHAATVLKLFREGQPFHAFLCDVNLGLDSGWKLAGQIWALQPNIRIIILSGEIIHDPPVVPYDYTLIFKPFSPKDLLAAIEEQPKGET